MPVKLTYTVHGVDRQDIERVITTPDGDEGRLTIHGYRVQLTSENDALETIGFFLSDAAAEKSGLDFAPGDEVNVTIRKGS